MTASVSMGSFRASAEVPAGVVALVTVTVVGAISFTGARCICGHKVMTIPGVVRVEVRVVVNNDRTGNGRVVDCRKCRRLLEIVEHR